MKKPKTGKNGPTPALENKIRKTGRPLNRVKIDALTNKIMALPVLDTRAADDILGYDDFGIPR